MLARQDPSWFEKQIITIVIKEFLTIKAENVLYQTALAIDSLLKANLINQQTIKLLYDSLIEKMRNTNKRETDEQIIDLAFCCFEALDLSDKLESYVSQAQDFCRKSQNISTQSIGAFLLVFLAPKMQHS